MSKTHRVPTGTIAPSTTYKTFDLNDFINDLPSAFARMQAAQSYAWRIDTMIVQAVRTLFKACKDTAVVGELDTAADYNNALAEQAFAEQCFLDIGSDSAGPVRTLHEMLDLRPEAHAMAREATRAVLDWKGNMRSYEEPDLASLFEASGTIKPKATTLARMQLLANRSAAKVATGKDLAVMAQKLYTGRVAREKARLAGMQEAMQQQVGALQTMFNVAVDHLNKNNRLEKHHCFHQIDIEHQRTLIVSTKQALARAEEYATSDSNMPDAEFDSVVMVVEMATQELDKVLRSPRFNCGVDGNAPAPAVRAEKLVPKIERPPIKAPVEPKVKAAAKAAKPKVAKPKPIKVTTLADLGQVKDLLAETTPNEV